MGSTPVLSDIPSGANPNAIVLSHVVEKLGEPDCARGAADEPVVKVDRHQFRALLALS